MSFSGDIREELYPITDKGRNGQIAELCALVGMATRLVGERDARRIVFASGQEFLRRKYFTLIGKTTNIDTCGNDLDEKETKALFAALKISVQDEGGLSFDGIVLQQENCKRAFLRGAFLCGGTVSDPTKAYHFEIVTRDASFAGRLLSQTRFFAADAGLTRRKDKSVVYVKDGTQIAELIGQMGAHKSLLAFENARILNDMRGNVNRRVNCETANIKKTVHTSLRQIACIHKIEQTAGLDSLPESLRQMAEIRLQYPDETLEALGRYLDPPVGKSGVNHRLRRIVDIADNL